MQCCYIGWWVASTKRRSCDQVEGENARLAVVRLGSFLADICVDHIFISAFSITVWMLICNHVFPLALDIYRMRPICSCCASISMTQFKLTLFTIKYAVVISDSRLKANEVKHKKPHLQYRWILIHSQLCIPSANIFIWDTFFILSKCFQISC